MVHDRVSGVFVPVYYVLCTSRDESAYWNMVHFITQGTDQQIQPAEVACDFESALQNAIQTRFPNAIVVGCLFHMKQAVSRAIMRFGIPELERTIAMTEGVLDILTVIDPAQVKTGTRWVNSEIRQRCAVAGTYYSEAKWQGCGGYFAWVWLEQYDVQVWNVFGLRNELIAGTNNPLERFNRELNSRIPTHQSITTV
ncbi:unnamed protein product [Phytophthora fragariaefolia]|uniref:Unnamed protein product n=1 Tax=Phytophthora fragariaefolia TaxID=1490495 RepID=A0A9W6TW86_9STRA|nr:unnamed protein product [Phytophthora fragariaefolia]